MQEASNNRTTPETPDVCIIGAGFSGVCAAVQLQKKLGLTSFTVFDSNEDVGGTWLVNTYPGCECDVQSHLYSLSFENNPDWSSNFSPQPEIWRYLQKVAKKYNVYPHVKFNTDVKTLTWQDDLQKWKVDYVDKSTNNNEEKEMLFDIVINGCGALRDPFTPEQFLPFQGPRMHSAEWDKSIEIEDKTVAVIGSGASAIQIIPAIAKKVKKLYVYQRRPAWITPKVQFKFPDWLKQIFAHVPLVMWLFRCFIFLVNDFFVPSFYVGTRIRKFAKNYADNYRKRVIKDPELLETLTPNYELGCKRILKSPDYFEAIQLPNVEVHTSHVDIVTEDSIITKDGEEHKIDVLVLATGFKIQEFFSPMQIYGKDGADILNLWKKFGPKTYNGIVCREIPNHFWLLGPNSALGHSSVVFQIECQVDYAVSVIEEMMRRQAKTMIIKKDAVDKYMNDLDTNFKKTVWANAECGSWYANERGENTTLWPQSCTSYWRQTKKLDFDMFDCTY